MPNPTEKGVAGVVERNVAALLEHRRLENAGRKIHGHIAEVVTRFVGSGTFICLHLLFLGAWFVINRGGTPLRPFDHEFYLLGTVAGVEAIFLSTFVLIGQNPHGRPCRKARGPGFANQPAGRA